MSIDYRDESGRRVRQPTEFPQTREGFRKAKKLEDELRAQAKQRKRELETNPGKVITFDQLMLEFVKENPGYFERDKYTLKHLYKVFSGRLLNSIERHEFHAYIVERQKEGASAGTLNKEVSLVSRAVKWAYRRHGWVLPNIAAGAKLQEPEGRIRWLTFEEYTALLKAAESEPKAPHLVDFIRFSVHTGARAGEALGLEWKRVDLQRDLIYLDAVHPEIII